MVEEEKKEMEERREGGRDRDRKLKKKGRWGVGAIWGWERRGMGRSSRVATLCP